MPFWAPYLNPSWVCCQQVLIKSKAYCGHFFQLSTLVNPYTHVWLPLLQWNVLLGHVTMHQQLLHEGAPGCPLQWLLANGRGTGYPASSLAGTVGTKPYIVVVIEV